MQKANSTIPIARTTINAPLNRKHMNRHLKPFGCTQDGCNKVFGSKSDWKIHENTKHHQLECWKCNITKASGTDAGSICGKRFFRKWDFINHLKALHRNIGDHVQYQIVVDCHIPKYHEGAFWSGFRPFWCGFCKKAVKLHPEVDTAWNLRFDHIARHFEEDNLRVKDAWIPFPDDDQNAL